MTAPRLVSLAADDSLRLRVRPAAIVQVALLALAVGNLVRIPLLSTGDRDIPVLFNDLCVAVVLGVALMAAVEWSTLRVDRVSVAALAFAGIGAFSALLSVPRFNLNTYELAVSVSYLARWTFYFAFYVAVLTVVKPRDVRGVWTALETCVLLFAAFGVLQAAFLPNFAQLVYPESRVRLDWDPQGHRLVSSLLDPNLAGALILMVLLVHVAMLSSGEKVAFWKPLLLFAALVLTLSRSSLLAFAVGGMVILVMRGLSRRLMLAIGLFATAVAATLPRLLQFAASYGKLGIDESALSRLISWSRAFQVIRDHPWLGVGFNTYGFVQERYGWERMAAFTYSLDGGLLFITVMTGVIGLAVYITMLVLVARRCRTVARDPGQDTFGRGLAIGVLAVTIAMPVHSLFVNSLLVPFLMEPLWALWGLVAVLWLAARQRPNALSMSVLPAVPGR